MAKIYKYQKVTDEFTTYTVIEPDYKEGDERITELCIIENITYISVPDTLSLPDQPAEVVLLEVVSDEALYLAIEAASFHAQLINQRVADGLMTIAEGEIRKRAFGYIPDAFETPLEKVAKAKGDMQESVWWQKTNAQLNTYIDNNWDDPAQRKIMFKKLVKQVADIARRSGWDN